MNTGFHNSLLANAFQSSSNASVNTNTNQSADPIYNLFGSNRQMSPSIPTAVASLVSVSGCSVLWDIDSCPIPSGKSSNDTIKAILSFINSKGRMSSEGIQVFGCEQNLPKDKEFTSSGFILHECEQQNVLTEILCEIIRIVTSYRSPHKIILFTKPSNHLIKIIALLSAKSYDIIQVSSFSPEDVKNNQQSISFEKIYDISPSNSFNDAFAPFKKSLQPIAASNERIQSKDFDDFSYRKGSATASLSPISPVSPIAYDILPNCVNLPADFALNLQQQQQQQQQMVQQNARSGQGFQNHFGQSLTPNSGPIFVPQGVNQMGMKVNCYPLLLAIARTIAEGREREKEMKERNELLQQQQLQQQSLDITVNTNSANSPPNSIPAATLLSASLPEPSLTSSTSASANILNPVRDEWVIPLSVLGPLVSYRGLGFQKLSEYVSSVAECGYVIHDQVACTVKVTEKGWKLFSRIQQRIARKKAPNGDCPTLNLSDPRGICNPTSPNNNGGSGPFAQVLPLPLPHKIRQMEEDWRAKLEFVLGKLYEDFILPTEKAIKLYLGVCFSFTRKEVESFLSVFFSKAIGSQLYQWKQIPGHPLILVQTATLNAIALSPNPDERLLELFEGVDLLDPKCDRNPATTVAVLEFLRRDPLSRYEGALGLAYILRGNKGIPNLRNLPLGHALEQVQLLINNKVLVFQKRKKLSLTVFPSFFTPGLNLNLFVQTKILAQPSSVTTSPPRSHISNQTTNTNTNNAPSPQSCIQQSNENSAYIPSSVLKMMGISSDSFQTMAGPLTSDDDDSQIDYENESFYGDHLPLNEHFGFPYNIHSSHSQSQPAPIDQSLFNMPTQTNAAGSRSNRRMIKSQEIDSPIMSHISYFKTTPMRHDSKLDLEQDLSGLGEHSTNATYCLFPPSDPDARNNPFGSNPGQYTLLH